MEQNLSEFVGEIYETVHNPKNWQRVISLLCQMMDAKAAGLYLHDRKADDFRIVASFGLNAAVRESYDVGLGHYDYGYQLMQKKPVGKGLNLLSYDEVREKHPKYVQLLLKPNDAHYVGGLSIIQNEHYCVVIKLHRSSSHAPFENEELELLTQLHPHFERVMRIYWHYQKMENENFQLKSTLSKVSLGVVVVNRDAEVVYRNSVAESILLSHSGLDMQTGLKAYYENESQQLKTYIEDMFDEMLERTSPRARAIGLHHPDKNVPLILILTPNEKNQTSHGAHIQDCLTIYLSAPESPINIKEETLCQVHDLTMAEANIAISLANGLSLKDISERNQTSLGTVRTQIKQIFNKTGVKRQQDLVRLLVSGAYNLNVAE